MASRLRMTVISTADLTSEHRLKLLMDRLLEMQTETRA